MRCQSHRLTLGVLLAISLAMPFAVSATKVKIPKQDWAISFRIPYEIESKEISETEAGFSYRAMANHVMLKINVEPQRDGGPLHKDAYDYYWPKVMENPLLDQQNIALSETPQYVRVQYDLITKVTKGPKPATIKQRNVHYYFSFRGSLVDVHISILSVDIMPNPHDEQTFLMFEKSLKYGQ